MCLRGMLCSARDGAALSEAGGGGSPTAPAPGLNFLGGPQTWTVF